MHEREMNTLRADNARLRDELAAMKAEQNNWEDSAKRHHEDAKSLMRQRESMEMKLENAKGIIITQQTELAALKQAASELVGAVEAYEASGNVVEDFTTLIIHDLRVKGMVGK
jgi:chromosome segregation ATPase